METRVCAPPSPVSVAAARYLRPATTCVETEETSQAETAWPALAAMAASAAGLEKSACVIGITPGAMGTILGAAGTSIPNLLCSLYVARQGSAVMAAGEVWGSNIWLVFMCMGLPWGLYSSATGRAVKVQNSTALTIWIAACFLLFLAQSLLTGWRYTRVHAYAYIALYAAFVVFVFCNESLHFVDSTA